MQRDQAAPKRMSDAPELQDYNDCRPIRDDGPSGFEWLKDVPHIKAAREKRQAALAAKALK